MMLRVFMKTVFPIVAVGVISTLLSGDVFAGHRHGGGGGGCCDGGGGGGGGGSVPEIGAGSAAAALSLVVGGIYLLKDRFFGTQSVQTAE